MPEVLAQYGWPTPPQAVYLGIKLGPWKRSGKRVAALSRLLLRERRGEPRFGRLATAAELRQLEDQRGQDGELEGCSVCAEPFSTRDLGTSHDPTDRRRAVALACGHIFCEGCVAEWLRRESTCPLCRAEIADAGAGAGAASAPSMYLF